VSNELTTDGITKEDIRLLLAYVYAYNGFRLGNVARPRVIAEGI
jgi:hypothetical protein